MNSSRSSSRSNCEQPNMSSDCAKVLEKHSMSLSSEVFDCGVECDIASKWGSRDASRPEIGLSVLPFPSSAFFEKVYPQVRFSNAHFILFPPGLTAISWLTSKHDYASPPDHHHHHSQQALQFCSCYRANSPITGAEDSR